MKQWEYLSVAIASDETLNRIGRKGWKLVTITDGNVARFECPKVSQPPSDMEDEIHHPHTCQDIRGVNLEFRLRGFRNSLWISDNYYLVNYCPWCGERI